MEPKKPKETVVTPPVNPPPERERDTPSAGEEVSPAGDADAVHAGAEEPETARPTRGEPDRNADETF